MIAMVRGRVLRRTADSLIVDIGPLGLHLICSAAALAGAHPGQAVELSTSMVVREDSMTLFGFADDDERALFDTLQAVSGVGPKSALAMVSTLGATGVRQAVLTEDIRALTTAPGVGRKTAERIVIDLRDRVGALPAVTGAIPASSGWSAQVHAALVGLGWTTRDADAAVTAVASDPDAAAPIAGEDIAGLLRLALRGLDRG